MAHNRYPIESTYRSLDSENCIFISHQKKDAKIARSIADYFLNAGIDVYVDEYDNSINRNNPWSVVTAIKKGIQHSNYMLCLITPNTKESQWVPWEVGYGYDNTTEIGLITKEIDKYKLPEYFQVIQIIEGTKTLNEFISRIRGRNTDELINESKIIRSSAPNHPLDNILNWNK